ncbi:MAG: undecaprenyldiphospho-muramoylpentapeptide beta-N-acetylglucosaminyltransferase [Desulfovibrionaceae bacterium]|nr:undecaprenyldiphospho-muramoylpentapeptide beta-N-acetylglucosaminyltransferase [Desulfovibrionaceae bacterium]
MALRVILTTGGTGGHIFPALAAAEALKKRLPDADILFVGGLYGREQELAEKAGLPFLGLPVRGMLGRGLKALPAAWAMLGGIVRAWSHIHKWKPDVVMGFGGYAAFATVFAAWLRGRPTGLHEQNAVPGAANSILGRLVRRVCLSWPQPEGRAAFAPVKCVLTGNPIRAEIAAVGGVSDNGDPLSVHPGSDRHPSRRRDAAGRPTLLIMGGSQGAVAVNSLAISLLSSLRDAHVDILHQTGPKDLDRVRAAYQAHGYTTEDVQDRVLPFIDDMAAAYAWADLVLCRAGATTLAELACTGTPSVLVPFPFAAHDHQTGNARAMEDAGGAVLVPERDLEDRDMSALILGLLRDAERRERMAAGARSLARPEAAGSVADEIIKLATLQ